MLTQWYNSVYLGRDARIHKISQFLLMDLMIWGALSALGIFILIWKVGLLWFIRMEALTDIAFTVLMIALFWGTFSGMVIAVAAGLVFSLLLFLAKRYYIWRGWF